MVLVKGFSIKWKRDMFYIELLGSTPKGKEKLTKIHMRLPQVESLIEKLQKAVEKQKKKVPRRDVSYIG